MIEPVDADDDLTGGVIDARCAFTGCPTLIAHAVARRTRFEVLTDVILDACALVARGIEWVAIAFVLYGLFCYP